MGGRGAGAGAGRGAAACRPIPLPLLTHRNQPITASSPELFNGSFIHENNDRRRAPSKFPFLSPFGAAQGEARGWRQESARGSFKFWILPPSSALQWAVGWELSRRPGSQAGPTGPEQVEPPELPAAGGL